MQPLQKFQRRILSVFERLRVHPICFSVVNALSEIFLKDLRYSLSPVVARQSLYPCSNNKFAIQVQQSQNIANLGVKKSQNITNFGIVKLGLFNP